MAIPIEKRIINLSDADGNTKFAEVRVYEQFENLEAVLPMNSDGTYTTLEFDFDGLNDDNKETWSTEIDSVTFTGAFSSVVDIQNSGLFTETVSKPRTNRQDTN